MSDCCSSSPKKPVIKQSEHTQAGCCSAPVSTAEATASCCAPSAGAHTHHQKTAQSSCCDADAKTSFDWLLWGSLLLCSVFYIGHWLLPNALPSVLQHLAHGVFEMLNSMWWGVLVGIIFVGILAKIPQELVLSLLGKGGTVNGLLRATAAGVLLDLCSHGILMVGARLYKKGASLGQVMAFLIASPWNSFSLTIILIALIGWKWTLLFILLSAVIAVASGWIFDRCVGSGVLPSNPNTIELAGDFKFWPAAREHWQSVEWNFALLKSFLAEGLSGSRMVLRWLLFGVLLAAAIRSFVSLEFFQHWFGPSLLGVFFTLIAATVIEVCSEGSTPIAADLLNRAAAPGNAFTFMMAGVSTDYTEIMVLKETMQSWKISLFLPLITLPQILVIAIVLNHL